MFALNKAKEENHKNIKLEYTYWSELNERAILKTSNYLFAFWTPGHYTKGSNKI